MLFDWIAREGWIVFNWWVLVTVAGATVFPLLVRLLGGLPDCGYTLARPAGMLLIAFVFWLLAILRFVDNSVGSVILAWLVVLGVSLTVSFTAQGSFDWRAWWQENRTVVIVSEVLFAALLVVWAIFRAHQNELVTTEKPMDLAFISAIQHSETFPPNDPWLSGYAISYYYFGYVMAATMSMMTGVVSTIGLNMHIALLFALTGTTTFGIGYNLVRSRAFRLERGMRTLLPKGPSPQMAAGVGLLAMVFMVWIGNFQLPLVEIPYQTGEAPASYLRFWDVDDRRQPLDESMARESVDDWSYWWWFRASRSIDDKSLENTHVEVIAEFPQFSFLLADSHPHVMALPFALLSMGLALNVLLSAEKPDKKQTLLYGLCVGALIFLNTWDTPVYLVMLVVADMLRRLKAQGRLLAEDWQESLGFGVRLFVIGAAAYLPFVVGFRSQLQGILPNLIHPTQFPQLFLMFGPFFLIVPVFLVVEIWRGERAGRMNWRLGTLITASVLGAAVLVLVGITLFGWLSAETRHSVLGYIDQHGGWDQVWREILSRRIATLLTPLVLLFMLVPVVGRLLPPLRVTDIGEEWNAITYPPATGFALMLVGTAVLLILIPEFVYLRDNFGTRMNTVFKLYYQAWAAFSLAGAYATYTILADWRLSRPLWPIQAAFGVLLAVVLTAGSLYPALGMYHRMFIETGRKTAFNPAPLTLDGGPGFVNADDYNAIVCLRDLVGRDEAIVAEANPESGPEGDRINYNPNHGRVGALTGIPILIGWPNHESQWRGSGFDKAVGTRRQDLDILYTDLRMDVVARIIEQYEIDYIMYGFTERQHYGSAGEEKFREYYQVVCESGNSRVYRVNPLPQFIFGP